MKLAAFGQLVLLPTSALLAAGVLGAFGVVGRNGGARVLRWLREHSGSGGPSMGHVLRGTPLALCRWPKPSNAAG